MALEEESINLLAHRVVLKSFSLRETSVEQNLHHAYVRHDSLVHQWVAAEDAPEMAYVLDAERENVEHIIKEEQAHRVQVAALSQMQLHTMQQVKEWEKELQGLSVLLVEHQAMLQSAPERPHHALPQAPPPVIKPA